MSRKNYESAVRQASKAATSEQLLAVARPLFAERGYAGVPELEICEAAGVTRGALQHNFRSKRGLFEAVVAQVQAEIGDHLLDHDVSGLGQVDAFLEVCREYLRLALRPDIQRIMFVDGPAVLGERLREIDSSSTIEPLTEAVVELVDAGLFRPVDAVATAVMLNGAMIDAAIWSTRHSDPVVAVAAAADSLEKLIRGLHAS